MGKYQENSFGRILDDCRKEGITMIDYENITSYINMKDPENYTQEDAKFGYEMGDFENYRKSFNYFILRMLFKEYQDKEFKVYSGNNTVYIQQWYGTKLSKILYNYDKGIEINTNNDVKKFIKLRKTITMDFVDAITENREYWDEIYYMRDTYIENDLVRMSFLEHKMLGELPLSMQRLTEIKVDTYFYHYLKEQEKEYGKIKRSSNLKSMIKQFE